MMGDFDKFKVRFLELCGLSCDCELFDGRKRLEVMVSRDGGVVVVGVSNPAGVGFSGADDIAAMAPRAAKIICEKLGLTMNREEVVAKDDMKDRHQSLIEECTSPNNAWQGPAHLKPHDLIERERQTRLLAAILEKLHG